ncbi:MAG: DUF3015 family protein [Nitrospirae bacterium]|nr:DUF3015 family protein [Nitrospirota bacterium]
MKKFVALTVAFISLLFVGSSFAADGEYGAAGCGLGSLLFGKQPGFVQVFAATTNNSTYTNMFGITSGTSNCNKNTVFASNDRLNSFVQNNLDNLAKEIAMGEGESLDTLAELMEIPVEEKTAFNKNLQANFKSIFPSKNVVVAGVINNIIAVTLAN